MSRFYHRKSNYSATAAFQRQACLCLFYITLFRLKELITLRTSSLKGTRMMKERMVDLSGHHFIDIREHAQLFRVHITFSVQSTCKT